jgi:DNA-directed RNA polymerase specialized sigma24 family protein
MAVQGHGGSALGEPSGFLMRFSALVHAHRGRLLSYARRRGLDADDALDAVQDSFISFSRLAEAQTIADEKRRFAQPVGR